MWDFGGQEIYHAAHRFFLTPRSLYVLVDDTKKDDEFASDERFRYWLDVIDIFGGHSPTLMFQNEKGGRSKEIDVSGIKRRYDNVKEIYSGNLKRKDAVNDLRAGVELYASQLPHIGEELPARWLRVREKIETLAAKQPYVPVEKYFAIYGKYIEFNAKKALQLSRYLHDLGVFLHFQDDPVLRHTVILQNQWATEAVFRMLDDKTVKNKFGRFNGEDCARFWKGSVYAEMHPELLALMKNFELCYELQDSRPQTWLAPQLLPPAEPAALADWAKPGDLVWRYHYEFLPKGIISRLMVRLHRFVLNPGMAWRTGVLFERGSTRVLVKVLLAGNDIELRARGPERQALLNVVAAELDALNDSLPGLREKAKKRIPCNCKRCSTASVPLFFEYTELVRRRDCGKLKVECGQSFEEVNVLELLDGVTVETLPAWANQTPIAPSVRRISIFLASSSELREDRDAFELYCRQQNDWLVDKGHYLEIVRWENFLDAMSETRLQDEYNDAVRKSDIFVSLFFTRAGKFTEEEFDAAYGHFKDTKKPRIYTYFKNAYIRRGDLNRIDLQSLWVFQDKLTALGHYPTEYDNIDQLKLKFRDQLDEFLKLIG